MSIKQTIVHIIKCSLDKLNIDTIEDNIVINIPSNKENGDYSSNIALILASKLHKNPIDIAQTIIENIEDNEVIDKIAIAKPGFINIFIKKDYLLKGIKEILTLQNHYGDSTIGNNEKINVEFVSANPTGTLHIGHGRGAAYGDNLSRILLKNGFDVTKEYYINDAGNQMNNLGISIKERYRELCGLECNLPENGYHGKEIIELAKKLKNEYGNTLLDKDIEYFKKQGLNVLLEQIKKDLDRFRVNFNVFTSEQSLYDRNAVEEVLTELKNTDHCYIKDDALWLKTTEYGDEKDRVLVKNDGDYTYFLPDIAYHKYKYERNFDKLIDVLGSDHHGYINRLKAAMKILGEDSDKLEIKILQMVRLIKDGAEFKLSKRTGKSVTLMELLDDIGINATRYFFASHSLDTSMDLDLDLALKQSNENPVYYIEYANARICSIIKNSKFRISELQNIDKFVTLTSDMTYSILNKLYEYPDLVISAGIKEQPHIIANYAYSLATLFHSYYQQEKIITSDTQKTKERVALLMAIKIVLNNALDLIGIIPREEM